MTTRCQYCGRELPTKDFALPGHRPMPITLPCDCEEAREAVRAEEARIEREERAKAFSEVWSRAGIPAIFQHVGADFKAARPLQDGRALYVFGDNGRGKTHVACQAAKAYLVHNTYRDKMVMRCWKSCMFVTSQDVFSQLRSSWDRWDQSEEDVFQRLAGVDLLVLDDFGKGVPSEWAAESMFRVIDMRWSQARPTIFTSQYTITELRDRYERAEDKTMGAMVSRLEGWCDVTALTGEDRRLARI